MPTMHVQDRLTALKWGGIPITSLSDSDRPILRRLIAMGDVKIDVQASGVAYVRLQGDWWKTGQVTPVEVEAQDKRAALFSAGMATTSARDAAAPRIFAHQRSYDPLGVTCPLCHSLPGIKCVELNLDPSMPAITERTEPHHARLNTRVPTSTEMDFRDFSVGMEVPICPVNETVGDIMGAAPMDDRKTSDDAHKIQLINENHALRAELAAADDTGKTLRDEFAMAALLSASTALTATETAEFAYKIADAMMKARAR